MNFTRVITAVLGTAVLAACTQQAPQQKPTIKAIGTVELAFEVGINGQSLNIRPQTVLADNVISGLTKVAGQATDDGTNRYVYATYEFTNASGSTFDNLTFYAYNQATNNAGGTAIKNLVNFGGSSIATSAQSLLPTHGTTGSAGSSTILATREDLQVFSTTEASTAETASTPSILATPDTVLEYGFVARAIDNLGNPTGGRTIASGAKGRVTAAYKFPIGGLSNSSNPYSFVATFLLANETTPRVTRSPEETDSDANARASALTANQVVLGGVTSTYGGTQIPLANAAISTNPTYLLKPFNNACGAPPSNYLTIAEIQGANVQSSQTGAVVTTEGVVVADFQGVAPALGGYYIQSSNPDGNSNTSEGLYIFNSINTADVGDYVRVTGTVAEFKRTNAADPTNITQTQLSTITSFTECQTGVAVTPTTLNFPLPNGQNDLEKFENMLVTIPQTMTVSEHFLLGRFGQITVSSSGNGEITGTDNRLDQFTQNNAPSVSGYAAHLAELGKRRLVIDDAQTNQNADPIVLARGGNPLSAANTLRGGDTAINLTGILEQRLNSSSADSANNTYRLQPTIVANFSATNIQPSLPLADLTGLRIASFNVLNFFVDLNTLPNDSPDNPADNFTNSCGNSQDPRGANTAAEFTRQKDKIVQAILGINPDVLGVIEMQNNGTTAINDLISGLNSIAGAGTFAAATAPSNGYGCDAIKVDFIYKPARVNLLSIASPDTTVYTSFTQARSPVAATFQQISNGATFTAVMNHFKSKSSSAGGIGDADSSDGQGLSNGTRVRNANDLKNWLATNPTATTDPDFILMGDFNAYAEEDPMTTLETAGYSNVSANSSYSYVFDGTWGSLDHALTNTTLNTQVTSASKLHINSDEPNILDYNVEFKSAGQVTGLYAANPFRSSDHDPVVVEMNLTAPVTPTFSINAAALSNSNYVSGTAGTATSTITINRTSFPDPITLSLEVSPTNAGITATSFTNNPNSTGTSTLNLNVDTTVAAGNYTLTVKGTSNATVISSNTLNIVVAQPCTGISVTPTSASIAVAGTQNLTATLTPSGCVPSAAVSWSSADTNIASVNTLSGVVTGVAAGGPINITATSGALSASSAITVTASVAASGLVINEVDYDQSVNPDSTEYVEIFNPTSSAISTANLALVFINGNGNAEYLRVSLGSVSSIPAGGYLVVASTNVTVPVSAGVIRFAGAVQTDRIQNGAPDGIALIDTVALTVLDALSYEGSVTAAVITGFLGTVNLVEGTALVALDSGVGNSALARSSVGLDTNNANTDWTLVTTLTPGTINP